MRGWVVLLMAGLVLVGCGGGVAPEAGKGPETDPHDPTILVRPFTAEQIRDAWKPGLTMIVEHKTPGKTHVERWTVLRANAEGAEIQYAVLDDEGRTGETRVERSDWVELRDHAKFPVERSRREAVTRDTPLGPLDGWLYTVRDDASGAVTEFFFARSLPGAPAHMRVLQGDDVVMEFTQIERTAPRTTAR